MASFKNEQGITKITMTKRTHNYCPLGKDWYCNDLTIEVIPDSIIPDYIDIDNTIKNDIEGKNFIIEDVVSKIVDIIKEYSPKYIKVVSDANDAVHLPVKVEKEWIKE